MQSFTKIAYYFGRLKKSVFQNADLRVSNPEARNPFPERGANAFHYFPQTPWLPKPV